MSKSEMTKVRQYEDETLRESRLKREPHAYLGDPGVCDYKSHNFPSITVLYG